MLVYRSPHTKQKHTDTEVSYTIVHVILAGGGESND